MPMMGVPKLNKPMHRKLFHEPKQLDSTWQKQQRQLQKGLCAIAQLLKRLRQAEDKKAREMASDAYKLLAHLNKMINKERRFRVVKRFDEVFKHLLDNTRPTGTQLFGDDLTAALKECNTVSSKILYIYVLLIY